MYDLLKGLTVVEGSAFIAGPTCGLYLAQLGAQVIRFDNIGGGPDFRRWPLAANGSSLYWEGLNKGKKSVAIDLSSPQGRELAQRLAAAPGKDGGLFVTNFPVEGFLAYDRLKAIRDDVICVRVMGWADGGPGVDYTINSAVGVPLMTGHPDDPRPVNHVLPAWDLLTGAFAAFNLTAALLDRYRTGRGREIRIPLSDVAASALANMGMTAEILAGEGERPRQGNTLFGAFGRDFLTRDGQRLMVVAITPRQWTGLIEVLGVGEAVAAVEASRGVDFRKDEGVRFAHVDALMPIFEAGFARADSADLAPRFDALGVCWGPYQTLAQAMDDPRLFKDNPIFSDLTQPSGATYPAPGYAATLPQDERQPPAPAAALGAHTEEVLGDLLGLDAAEIARLHDAGIVASA